MWYTLGVVKKISLSLLTFFVACWALYLQLSPDKTTTWNYLYNIGYGLLYFFGAFMGVTGAIRLSTQTNMGKALLYLGLGLGSYGSGLVIWSYYNIILQVEIPYPSASDILFLFFIPLIAAGCLSALGIVRSQLSRRSALEAVGIFIISSLVVFGFLNRPDLSRDLPFLTKLFNIAYPLGDTILLTLAYTTVRISGGGMRSGMMLISLGLLFQVLGDMVFAYRTTTETYWNGDIADILFSASAAISSFGMLRLFDSFTQVESRPAS